MAADVEQEILVCDGAADAADIDRVALDDDDGARFLGQALGGGEAGGPGTDHEHFGIDAHQYGFQRGFGWRGDGVRGRKANSAWPL